MSQDETILLAHGGGGSLTQELIENLLLPAFGNDVLRALDDSACLTDIPSDHELAFTTDSYVVSPYRFPGGDIGRLAISGTVNDLAMVGARPVHLSCGLILEEGLPIADLKAMVQSMRETANEAKVTIVTGDTKVVPRGNGDGIYINTSGIGWIPRGRRISVSTVRPGDAVLVTGTMGDHGTAVMATRENLGLTSDLRSDVAPLAGLAATLLETGVEVHGMRDPTRGGLAQTLCEIAARQSVRIDISQDDIPVRPSVEAICDLLGLDVLQVANEGKFVAFVPKEQAEIAWTALKKHPLGIDAAIIGEVVAGRPSVVLHTSAGGARLVEPPTGELLPRIC